MAIANAIEYGPSFLSSPNTWWAVSVFVVWLVVMRWIWRRGSKTNPLTEIRLSATPECLKASIKTNYLWSLLDEMSKFCSIVSRHDLTADDEQYARHMLENGYRYRIEDLLGKSVLKRYFDALKLDQGAPIKVTCQAALHVIAHACTPIFEEAARKYADNQRTIKDWKRLVKAIGLDPKVFG